MGHHESTQRLAGFFICKPVHIQFDFQISNLFVGESGEKSFLFLGKSGTGAEK